MMIALASDETHLIGIDRDVDEVGGEWKVVNEADEEFDDEGSGASHGPGGNTKEMGYSHTEYAEKKEIEP
jgi:hypothetical protein